MINSSSKNFNNKKAVIIGAGISGTSAAYFLSKNGWNVTILERAHEIATQASGNSIGILYPRIEAVWNNITEFYYNAFNHLVELIKANKWEDACNFHQCGIIIYPHKERDLMRFEKINAYNKHYYAKLVSKEEATEISGMALDKPCLYLPTSGTLSIPKLCKLLTKSPGIEVKFGTKVTSLQFDCDKWNIFTNDNLIESSEVVVVANSYDAQNILPENCIEIQMVRGQINYLPEISDELKTILCYGGYLTPNYDGYHHLGATFDKNFFNLEISESSTSHNLKNLQKYFPKILPDVAKLDLKKIEGRASIRAYSKDKLPVIGPCPNLFFYKNRTSNPYLKGLYLSICHGSRGALSATFAGKMLADELLAENLKPHGHNMHYKLLNPSRFYTNYRQ